MLNWKPIGLIVAGIVVAVISFGTDCVFGCANYNHLPHQLGEVVGLLLVVCGIFLFIKKKKQKGKA